MLGSSFLYLPMIEEREISADLRIISNTGIIRVEVDYYFSGSFVM